MVKNLYDNFTIDEIYYNAFVAKSEFEKHDVFEVLKWFDIKYNKGSYNVYYL